MSLRADYYDGHSSKQRAVSVRLEGHSIRLQGEGVDRIAPLDELRLSEPLGDAPRLITFPDGAFCEIRDTQALGALLSQTGYRDHFVVRWQYNRRWIALSACLCLAIFYAGYRFALPWAAEKLAAQIPERALQSISMQIVESLDHHALAPSRLPYTRQEAIAARFAALRRPSGEAATHRVIFRANRAIDANAFALPDGTIILTDGLVKLAAGDSELMGVLAHELGHADARHGMRQVIQGSVVGLLTAWFVGDISSIAAAAPAALLQARYSREFERDADRFASRMLEANAISPRCLADLLERLGKPPGENTERSASAPYDYLSSHPATGERLAALSGAPCE